MPIGKPAIVLNWETRPKPFSSGDRPGAELDLVDLDRSAADGEHFEHAFARGAEVVRGVKTVVERRILLHAEPEVAGEAARGHDHALACAVGLEDAGVFLRELVAFADLEADHAAVGVADEGFHLGVEVHVDAVLAAAVGERTGDAAARGFDGLHDARDAVAAEVLHEGLVLDAVLEREVKGGTRAFDDHLEQVDVGEAAAGTDHVLKHAFGTVLDAFLFLKRRTRDGEGAAVDGGVAAEDGHLFDEKDFGALEAGLKRGGKAGKARAHDDHVVDLVEGGSAFLGVRRARGGGESGHRAAGEKAAAGAVDVLSHEVLLGMTGLDALLKARGMPNFGARVPGLVPQAFAQNLGETRPRC